MFGKLCTCKLFFEHRPQSPGTKNWRFFSDGMLKGGVDSMHYSMYACEPESTQTEAIHVSHRQSKKRLPNKTIQIWKRCKKKYSIWQRLYKYNWAKASQSFQSQYKKWISETASMRKLCKSRALCAISSASCLSITAEGKFVAGQICKWTEQFASSQHKRSRI